MNKNGWGLRTELLFIIILLIALLVSTIFINELGLFEGDKIDTSNNNYYDIENELVSSTKNYVNQNYDIEDIDDNLLVKASTLIENNYMDDLKDMHNRKCSGYVEVKKEGVNLLYYPYIKCNGYITSDYDSSKD